MVQEFHQFHYKHQTLKSPQLFGMVTRFLADGMSSSNQSRDLRRILEMKKKELDDDEV